MCKRTKKNPDNEIAKIINNVILSPNETDYIGNKFIFKFIQALKGIDKNLHPEELKIYVEVFWEIHEEDIRGTTGNHLSLDETWAVFLDLWPKVKYGAGNKLAIAQELALMQKEPPEAERYQDQNIRHLITICYCLQKLQGTEPFWMSCIDAGKILNKSQVIGNSVLKMFITEGILELVAPNTSKLARRYRYVHFKEDIEEIKREEVK